MGKFHANVNLKFIYLCEVSLKVLKHFCCSKSMIVHSRYENCHIYNSPAFSLGIKLLLDTI